MGDIREIDTGAPMTRFARCWHCLGLAEDFRDGQPHGIEAFGTKLVVFADSGGALKVLRRVLPAFGRRSVPGQRQGRRRRVSVHDWRWAGDGKCTLVPYAKRTPRLARTRSWLNYSSSTTPNTQLRQWN